MYIERLQEEISGLIEKIKLDWSRIKTHSPGIHQIDKDIITGDIRRLYDLIYEFDLGNPEPKTRKAPEPSIVQNKTVPENQSQISAVSETRKYETDSSPVSAVKVVDEVLSSTVQTDEIEVHLKQKVVVSEILTVQPELEWLQKNEDSLPDFGNFTQKPQPNQPKQALKSTIDLFTAPKTIADIFQNNTDDSFAARMQKNPINDIKSAIGINEKFLFINTIFDGEISLYNKAIERLNELPDFYLALHFIDELKANYEKETNRDSFIKLMEIVKRKYL